MRLHDAEPRSRLPEARRLRQNDVLIVMLTDLQHDARRLDPFDADARTGWVLDAARLLSRIPHRAQRVAWALLFADAMPDVAHQIFPTAHALLTLAQEVHDDHDRASQ